VKYFKFKKKKSYITRSNFSTDKIKFPSFSNPQEGLMDLKMKGTLIKECDEGEFVMI